MLILQVQDNKVHDVHVQIIAEQRKKLPNGAVTIFLGGVTLCDKLLQKLEMGCFYFTRNDKQHTLLHVNCKTLSWHFIALLSYCMTWLHIIGK